MGDSDTEPRRALGAFLRARRELLPAPSSFTIRRRRTPGLRREEVAEACGVSATRAHLARTRTRRFRFTRSLGANGRGLTSHSS